MGSIRRADGGLGDDVLVLGAGPGGAEGASLVEHLWRIVEMVVLPLVVAVVVGLWRLFLSHRDLKRDQRVDRERIERLEERVEAVPELTALLGQLREGFRELKDAFNAANAETQTQLRDQGEKIAYIAGQMRSGTRPRRIRQESDG